MIHTRRFLSGSFIRKFVALQLVPTTIGKSRTLVHAPRPIEHMVQSHVVMDQIGAQRVIWLISHQAPLPGTQFRLGRARYLGKFLKCAFKV